jgi:hypothetical protein
LEVQEDTNPDDEIFVVQEDRNPNDKKEKPWNTQNHSEAFDEKVDNFENFEIKIHYQSKLFDSPKPIKETVQHTEISSDNEDDWADDDEKESLQKSRILRDLIARRTEMELDTSDLRKVLNELYQQEENKSEYKAWKESKEKTPRFDVSTFIFQIPQTNKTNQTKI